MNGDKVFWGVFWGEIEGSLSLQWSSQLTVLAEAASLYIRNNSGNCLMSQDYPWILQRLACCDTHKNKNQSWVTGDSSCVSKIMQPECYGGVFCFHSCSPPSLWWCSFSTLLNVKLHFTYFLLDNVLLFAYSLHVFWNGGRPLCFMWCAGNLNWKGQNL